jgi:hypothetical protein
MRSEEKERWRMATAWGGNGVSEKLVRQRGLAAPPGKQPAKMESRQLSRGAWPPAGSHGAAAELPAGGDPVVCGAGTPRRTAQ